MKEHRIPIANYITLSRFFLVPVFIYLFLKEKYLAAFFILGFTGFTDLLDGLVARRFNMRSHLGSMLDPLADKFLMLVSFIVLSRAQVVPWELTLIVLGRDFLIILGAGILNLMRVKLYYRPTRLSKLTTLSQILVLAFSFLYIYFRHYPSPWFSFSFAPTIQQALSALAAGLTIITFFQYTYIGYNFYRYGERKQP